MTDKDTPASNDKQTFEEVVNSHVASMTQGDDGNWALPDGTELDEPTKYAVNAERRRRDTQAAYSRTQAENKRLAAEATKLAEHWEQDFVGKLTTDQQTELEELKATDPDAWRIKLNEYETASKEQFAAKKSEVSSAAKQETELEQRERLFTEFQEANPELNITDDVLENDIPPRYVKQLEKGEVTFEDFLANVKGYLTAGKVIKEGEQLLDEPNLGTAGGSAKPTNQAVEADARASYKNETY